MIHFLTLFEMREALVVLCSVRIYTLGMLRYYYIQEKENLGLILQFGWYYYLLLSGLQLPFGIGISGGDGIWMI